LVPTVFKAAQSELEGELVRWLGSDNIYTVIFALNILIKFYMKSPSLPRFIEIVSQLDGELRAIRVRKTEFFIAALESDFEKVKAKLDSGSIEEPLKKKIIKNAICRAKLTDLQREQLLAFEAECES